MRHPYQIDVVLLFLLIIVASMLSGCGSKDKTEIPLTDKDFRKGIQGLEIAFVTGAPPGSVFENTPFEVAAQISNLGAYDLQSGLLTLGIENDYMCQRTGNDCIEDKNTKPIQLDSSMLNGKSVLTPNGNRYVEHFSVKAREIDRLSNEHTSLIYLRACYDYVTEAVENVCIDPDPYSIKESEKVCTVKDLVLTDQGAPVAIKKIEINSLPHGDTSVRPQFIIHVKNIGDGDVIDKPRIVDACSAGTLKRTDWNKVYLERFGFSTFTYVYGKEDNAITCEPNPLSLSAEKEGYFRCSLDPEHALSKNLYSSFMTQAYARLGYGYIETESKQIVIEKIKKY